MRVSPERKEAAAEHRNTAAIPMSNFVPSRRRGINGSSVSRIVSSPPGGVKTLMPGVLAMGPGAMPATRILCGPHSRARERVMLSMAAFAADACTWYQVAGTCSVAEMLMMTPSADALSAGKAALLIVNTPFTSMSMTVLNPFCDSSAALARKFPAALLTRVSMPPNFSVTNFTAAAASDSFRTSPWKKSAWIPSFFIWSTAASSILTLLPISITFEPCSPSCLAISKPIPEPPPVTNTRRPDSASF
mmetsp:Transcript_38496/g.78928  ORF Transcript_38496/g.78928 Transcript_38496/m.78928 type:complete len:247 (+) Transcript_38496:135-875(+)